MADLKGLVPYKYFKFHVMFEGSTDPVAGVNKVGALTRTSEVVSWSAGGDPSIPHKSPGQVDYGPITLEQGLTASVEFNEWANKVWDLPNAGSAEGGNEVSLEDFRKNITIKLLNEAGQVVMAWNVFQCWVSEYTAVPELDASANAVAIRSMTIQNEGWLRDTSATEPEEPSFDDPS